MMSQRRTREAVSGTKARVKVDVNMQVGCGPRRCVRPEYGIGTEPSVGRSGGWCVEAMPEQGSGEEMIAAATAAPVRRARQQAPPMEVLK